MPTFAPYTKQNLDFALHLIGQAVYTPVAALDIRAWCTHEPVPYKARTHGWEHAFVIGEKWGELFDSAWFHFTGTVPASAAGQPVVRITLSDAMLIGQEFFRWEMATAVAGAILAINPESVVSASFQMSFAATVALIAGYEAIMERKARKVSAMTSRASPLRVLRACTTAS